MIPLWLVGCLFCGLKPDNLDDWLVSNHDSAFGVRILNNTRTAFVTRHLHDHSHDVLLYCRDTASINESVLLESLTKDLVKSGHSAIKMELPWGCTHGMVLSYLSESVSIQSADGVDTHWNIGWNSVSSSLFLSFIPLVQLGYFKSESFILPAKRQVTFPFSLFESQTNQTRRSRHSTAPSLLYANQEVSNLMICVALGDSLGDSTSAIVLQGGAGLQYTELSLAYWLELCGLPTAAVVHTHPPSQAYRQQQPLYEQSEATAAPAAPADSSSYCTVRYVTGLQPHCDLAKIHGHQCINTPSGQQSAICLEDIITFVGRQEACAPQQPKPDNTTACLLDAASWSECQLPSGRSQRSTISYVTSLGLFDLIQGTSGMGKANASGTAEDYEVLGLRDLGAVLRAFANSECTQHLRIHSVRSSLRSKALSSPSQILTAGGREGEGLDPTQPALSRLLLNLLLVFNSDQNAAQQYEAALSELKTRLTSTHDAGPRVLEQQWALLDALMTVFGADFRRLQHTCTISQASYICAHSEARTALTTLISKFMAGSEVHAESRGAPGNAGYVHRILVPKMRRYFEQVQQRIGDLTNEDSTARPPSSATYLGAASSAAEAAAAARVTERPMVRTFIDGDVHVLIFVRPEHLALTQRLVTHWQRHGAEVTNFLFVRFVVMPLEDSVEPALPATAAVAHGTRAARKLFYHRKPSLRAVLSLVKEKVEQVVTVKDLVYVLVGLESVLSFPQPGRYNAAERDILRQQCVAGSLLRSVACDANVVHQPHHQQQQRQQSEAKTQCDACDLCGNSSVQEREDVSRLRGCEFLSGVIPAIPYGGAGTYELAAKVVFAARRAPASPAGTSSSANDYAFVGVGHTVHHMITWVQAHADYPLASDVGVAALLDAYRARFPTLVHVDCRQHAFHATKGAHLLDAIVQKSPHGASVPISGEWWPYEFDVGGAAAASASDNGAFKGEPGLHPSNDSIAALLHVLHTPVFGSAVHTGDRTRYFPDLRTLLRAYVGADYARLLAMQPADLNYGSEILPFLHLDRLPYVHGLASQPTHDGDGEQVGQADNSNGISNSSRNCVVDLGDIAVMRAYIVDDLYLTERIFAAALASMGVLDQLALCECAERSTAVDEIAHIFTKMGISARHVSYKLDPLELPLTVALLEIFEQQLVQYFYVLPESPTTGDASSKATTTAFNSSTSSRSRSKGSRSEAGAGQNEATGNVTQEQLHRQQRYRTLPEALQQQFLTAVRFATAGLLQELGLFPDTVSAMSSSLHPAAYQDVRSRRQEWQQQRIALQQALNQSTLARRGSLPEAPTARTPKVHFVTYASDFSDGVQNLLFSAALAGIYVQVLGLGTVYTDYSSKTDAYWSYLYNGTATAPTDTPSDSHTCSGSIEGDKGSESCDDHESSLQQQQEQVGPVPDDDIVLFMDAYDVLVFPALANAATVLVESPTPILFCAERGIYPEFQGTYFYHRGAQRSSNNRATSSSAEDKDDKEEEEIFLGADGRPSSAASSAASQKFLNSGCILGRAGQMKRLLSYAKIHGRTYRDDQLAMVRFMLEHPDQVSLDSSNQLFLTNFKLTSVPEDVQLSYQLTVQVGDEREAEATRTTKGGVVGMGVGLLHCNNMRSGSSYHEIMAGLRRFSNDFYSGPDGPYLLQALRLRATGHAAAAMELLQHPTVLRNCSTLGGRNVARYFLKQHWTDDK